jgi:hypothetical protein
MKFSGLHFHMVLVIGLICVILYVFYISKDILTIDNELKNIKRQMETMQRMLINANAGAGSGGGSGGGVSVGVGQVSTLKPSLSTPYKRVDVDRAELKTTTFATVQDTKREVVVLDDDDESDDDDNVSIDSENIKNLLNNIQTDSPPLVKKNVLSEDNGEEDSSDDEDGKVEDVTDEDDKDDYLVDIKPVSATIAKPATISKDMPISELRRLCKEKGVSAKGSKQELSDRLIA